MTEENFARITVDGATPEPRPATATAPKGDAAGRRGWTWPSFFGAKTRAEPWREKAESAVAVAEGRYTVWSVARLLDALGIKAAESPKIDDAAAVALRYRLGVMGLRTATEIAGPLRLRLDDSVGVYRTADSKPLSTRSTLSLCLYALAWMMQAADVSPRELEAADAWIERYDPKSDSVLAAKATLRWLVGRRLVFTRRRKQRTARLARFAHRRDAFRDILLAMAEAAPGPRRMERLQTIYALIGLDPADIHGDLHRRALSEKPVATGTPPAAAIDRGRLRSLADSTEQARALLSDVFAEAEPEAAAPQTPMAAGPSAADAALQGLRGLDSLSREDFAAFSAARGTTPAHLLESLNARAYEAFGEPLLSDDGAVVTIDNDILNYLTDNDEDTP